MVSKRTTTIFLLAMTAIALYCSYLLFRPFLMPLLAAAVIAIVFFPVHSALLRRLRRPNLAALISTIIVVLLVVVPTVSVIIAIKGEVTNLVDLIREKTNESGGLSPYLSRLLEGPTRWLGQHVNLSQFDLRGWVVDRLQVVSAFLVAEGWMLVGGLTEFILNASITLFTLFFLFREGRSLRRRMAALLPLSPEQIEKLFGGIENTIIGTVYGGLVVALVQGALTGLALWAFGIPSPVLWGVVAAFFALLPVVGTAIVWLPAAIYLFADGHWIQAIVLAIWGAFVVSGIDNVLRPRLVAGRVGLSELAMFFALLGGLSVFGALGVVLGPVAFATAAAIVEELRQPAVARPSSGRQA